MQANETGVKERLLTSAKKEFLLHGFRNASLRKICAKAGVTTGALYFFFDNKEALFNCIVEKPLSIFEEMIQNAVADDWGDSAVALQNEEKIIRFLMQYKEEYQLILEKSEGTRYENFFEQYKMRMEAICTSYFEKNTRRGADQNLIRLLVSLRLQEYLELMKGNMSYEEVLKLTRYMACYADAGLAELVRVLNNEDN